MHFEDPAQAQSEVAPADSAPWYRDLTSYHWFVFVVAALGWLFDTMDQQLFNLARKPAVTYLIQASPGDLAIDKYAGYATTIFMIGWGIGGLGFGVLGDRIGRAKTMLLTILLYSFFTGLSAFATTFYDFAFYRFLTGLGVGGEFAVGVALVAEVMPDRARPMALGWLQASSAIGNMLAATLSILLGELEKSGAIGSAWRGMFVVGVLPALLSLFIFKRLKEPEKWKAANAKRLADRAAGLGADGPQMGSIRELFGDPRWRRNTIVGMLLALSGVVGLWGIGFFSFDLIRTVFQSHFNELGTEQGLTGDALKKFVGGNLTFWTGITSLLQNLGGFFGIYAYSRITTHIGRKPAFAISFVIAMAATAFTFWYIKSFYDIFWMIPLMGFCQLALFGGYAIYFPELFPTRLRSTGTSFCYNVGRILAAFGPLSLGLLTSQVYAGFGPDLLLVSSVKSEDEIPTKGRNLVIIANVQNALHFRVFDPTGEKAVDKTDSQLQDRTSQVAGLKSMLSPLWGATPISSSDKAKVIDAVTFILGHTPGYKSLDASLPLRYAGVTMCLVFLIGLAALPFAPETKGKPLPE